MCAGLEQEGGLLAFGPSSYGLPKFGISVCGKKKKKPAFIG